MVAIAKLFVASAAAVAVEGSQSCNSVCLKAGGVFGQIIGTAPACGASCANDCGSPHSICWTSSKDGGLVDYGHGCATGDKVCCCIGAGVGNSTESFPQPKQDTELGEIPIGHTDEVDQPQNTDDQAEIVDPIGAGIEGAVGSQSCNSVCLAAGGVFGQIIGTAPACGASCANDCSSPHSICWTSSKDGGLVDYGHGCVTGDKVCCCIGAGGTVSEAQVV